MRCVYTFIVPFRIPELNKSSSLLFRILFQLFGNELLLNVFILASWRSKKVMRLLFIIEVFIN